MPSALREPFKKGSIQNFYNERSRCYVVVRRGDEKMVRVGLVWVFSAHTNPETG